MGKPGQTADRSCSGALSRRIAHRVSMHVPLHNGVHFDAVVPKMAKQTFAFPASLRTRFLKWKGAPAAYYNHPNNHSRDRCPQLWSSDLKNNPLFGHECHAMPLCPNGGCKQCGAQRGVLGGTGYLEFNGEGYCVGEVDGTTIPPSTKKYACMPLNMKECTAPADVRYAWTFDNATDYVTAVCGSLPIGTPCDAVAQAFFWAYAKAWPDTHPFQACGEGQLPGYRCRTFPIVECDKAAANVGESCKN